MRVIDYIKVDGPMPEDIPDTQYFMWDCYVNSQVIAAQRFTQCSQS